MVACNLWYTLQLIKRTFKISSLEPLSPEFLLNMSGIGPRKYYSLKIPLVTIICSYTWGLNIQGINMTPKKQKHWKMEKSGHCCIEEKGGPSRFLCLVLLRLKRKSISMSEKILTSVLLSQHVLKLLLKLILGFKCTAPFSVRNVAMVWEKKTTIGKCFCRKGAFKKVKEKISGVYIRIQNVVLHVISGANFLTYESFLWLNSS